MRKKKIQSPKFTPIVPSVTKKNLKLLKLERTKMFTKKEMKEFMTVYSNISPIAIEKRKVIDYTRREIINEVMKELEFEGSEKEINDIKSQVGEAFKKVVQTQIKNGKTIEEIFHDSKANKEIMKRYIRNSLGKA